MQFLSLFCVDPPSWVTLGRGRNVFVVAILRSSALLGDSWGGWYAIFVVILRSSTLLGDSCQPARRPSPLPTVNYTGVDPKQGVVVPFWAKAD